MANATYVDIVFHLDNVAGVPKMLCGEDGGMRGAAGEDYRRGQKCTHKLDI